MATEMQEMSNYEFWSLVLTGTYDLLTFLLLAFTGYIALFQRRVPSISFYYQTVPKDTKQWSWRRANIDFVLENRGFELRNVSLRSEPDDLGWANFGGDDPDWKPKATSEYFRKTIPYLDQNAKKSFFWCDAQANKDVLANPFKVIIEFDNPLFFFLKRSRKVFEFDLSPKGIFDPVNSKYDLHNVAQEVARLRESIERIEGHLKGSEDRTDKEH